MRGPTGWQAEALPSQTHWRLGRGVFSGLGSTAGRTVASGMGIFGTGGLGATGGTKSPGLAASLGEASSVIFRNLGLLAGTGGGSDVGGPREDRWKDLSLSQFLEVATAMAAELETELVPWPGVQGSGLGFTLSRKQGFRRLGTVGALPNGGSLILRGVAGTLRPGSIRLKPNGSFLASSRAGPASGRLRLGGGGGSKGLGLLEVKEWARGKSEKAGFRGTGTGGGG